jgi:predicted site-specific integrase-resolvase
MRVMEFARRKGVGYGTVLDWLNEGLVPGATRKQKGGTIYWDIPETALEWKSPREATDKIQWVDTASSGRHSKASQAAGVNNHSIMTACEFARRKGVNYETVLKWLKLGLIPGAVKKATDRGAAWYIPKSALQMEKPQRGTKKGMRKQSL